MSYARRSLQVLLTMSCPAGFEIRSPMGATTLPAHCAGGPATDQFDAFEALVNWVEKGVPPEALVAKAGVASPWAGRTRPLCPYPKVARYNGSGSLEEAASFRCE
jgi:hypothetical protein